MNPQRARKGSYHCKLCGLAGPTLGSIRSHYTKAHPKLANKWAKAISASKRAANTNMRAEVPDQLPTRPTHSNPYPGSGVRPSFCPACGERLARWTRRA